MKTIPPPSLLAGVVILLILFGSPTAWADTAKNHASLRVAIEHLSAEFPTDYPKDKQFLARLDKLKPEDGEQFAALRREALVTANPLLAHRPILFAVRSQYLGDHHNTATLFQNGEINTNKFRGGGAIKMLDPASGRVSTILDVKKGVARDLEVSFGGHKILFSMRRDKQDDYHIYEIAPDGSGLKQLTYGPAVSDIDPMYLPDGKIIFSSTREPKFCMCNRHIMCNLFLMESDGANVRQIGHSTLFEGHPSLLPDGRILYDRWEYVDRNFGDAQGLWTVNPDGTNHAVYWGNGTNSPGAVLDARIIPDTELFIANFSSCHDRPWGAIAIVDRRLGTDGRQPVLRTWPPNAIGLVGQGNYDTFKQVRPKYEDPYPLSENFFLCARMTGQDEQMGIYLLDTFGNEILVHAEKSVDKSLGCYDPIPLAPRRKPMTIPPRIDLAEEQGNFFVADVYVGGGMENVPRGTVKYLRVVESPEKRFWSTWDWNGGTGAQAPAMAWNDFNNKRILGSVPVEADGSVYFSVPADRFVYFQLLDERGMMLQSMRSGTIVRPGETVGCVGCHENRLATASLGPMPDALRRTPRQLADWHGSPRLFNYLSEVQPVFDRHCVSCHDYDKAAGKTLNLAADIGQPFNTSYHELRKDKRFVNVVGAGPHTVLGPKSWGSHASRLAQVVLKGHGDAEIDAQVKLDPQSIDRIITWIDLNAPYYPDYSSGAFHENPFGRSPLDAKQTARLSQLVGFDLADRTCSGQINFTRPRLSPCLTKLKDPIATHKYKEALAIIEAGSQALQKDPRVDMAGFINTFPKEIARQQRYQSQLATEKSMRQAVVEGQRRYEGKR